jgi:starch-binding outer membrane protein, SusD/RagB family
MKLVLRVLLFLLVVIGLVTCEKLEENLLEGPIELSTQEQRFLTENDCDGAVRLCYNALAFDDWWQVHFWRLCNDAATDDAWVGDTVKNYDINPPRISNNPLDSNKARNDTIAAPPFKRRVEIMQAGHYTLDARGERLRDFYQSNFKGIFLCNSAIAGLSTSKIADNVKTRLTAEAKFLRGFYYFELVKNFGGVPVITSVVTTEYLDTMTRASVSKVYRQIKQDMTEAAAVLPTLTEQNAKDRGRATQGAAFAFLAKAELYDGNWAAALAAAKKVIEAGDYALEPNFGELWNPSNVNSQEFIFSIGTGVWAFNAFGNPIPLMCGTRAEKGWGYLCPTSNLERHYLADQDSVRLKWTIIKHQQPVPGDTTKRFNARPDVSKSARFSRKLYTPSKQRFGGSGTKLPHNVIFMRYADLLLMAAEAAYHTNNAGIALEYLGQVRQRAKLNVDNGLSGTALLNAIYKERRSELAFEGHRLFDLRRTKQLNQIFGTLGSFVTYNQGSTDFYETSNKREKQDKGVKYTANKHELWPIPQDELDRRRGLRQNPGY